MDLLSAKKLLLLLKLEKCTFPSDDGEAKPSNSAWPLEASRQAFGFLHMTKLQINMKIERCNFTT